jgi:protein TonB
MFDNLIESKAKRKRSFGGTAFSFVLHVVLIAAAVQGTLTAGQKLEKAKAEKVEFVQVKKEEPPPPKEQPKVEVPPDVVASLPSRSLTSSRTSTSPRP